MAYSWGCDTDATHHELGPVPWKLKKKQNLMATKEMVNTGFNPSSDSAGTSLPMDSAYKTDVICCSGIISG